MYTLRNGVEVPLLGFGTSTTYRKDIKKEIECVESVKCALQVGYRHIDTARFYENEQLVGKAITESGIERQEIFITTKLHPNDYGAERTRDAFNESLQYLGVDYLDLYLMHAPSGPWMTFDYEVIKRMRLDAWRVLIDLYNEGKCRAIGVSNYLPRHIQEIIDAGLMLPLVNQCEFHPYYTNHETRDFCAKHEIAFSGYCPIARGALLTDETVLALVKKYSKSAAQIAIRWSIQNNVITIPGSLNSDRIKENFEVNDFTLEKEDMDLLSSLNRDSKCSVDPNKLI